MDLDEEILSDFSDSEVVVSKHKNLLETISSLDKKSRLKPASRKEPSVQISEYHLVNKVDQDNRQKKIVDVNSLVKSLTYKPSNAHIAKKIATVHSKKKSQTLPKPLEKIHSDKIDRELGFESVKKEVSKWDPIVFDNRTSDHIKFPLKQIDGDAVEDERKKEKSHHEFLNTFKKPSNLELALANLLDSSKVVTQYREEKERREREDRERREANKNAEFKLTLKEMKEKQIEFVKLRAQKAFKEKKAWMQNKIKSKKYHRLMKREKVKEKLKEFEKLQKTDPEAALAQLELLDKTRAEERITLRHKSTGQWAKNLQVRAKYDKEARIALAEQLSQSRALSAKVKQDGDSSEEDKDEDSGVEQDGEDENPWMSREKEDVNAYFSGYRRYWQDKEGEREKSKPTVGTVSLDKLAETLDDLGDDYEMDMPVFIEAAYAQPKDNSLDEKDNEEEEEKKPENNEPASIPNKNKTPDRAGKKELKEKAKGDKLNKNGDLAVDENEGKKQRKRKSKIENILDKSGHWTVIPVDDDEIDNNESGRREKCDNATPSISVSKKDRCSNGKTVKCSETTKELEIICDSTSKETPSCDSTSKETPSRDSTSGETPQKKRKNKRKSAGKLDLSSDLAIDEAFDSLESSWKEKVNRQVKVISKAMSKQERVDGKEKRKTENEEVFDFNDRKRTRKAIDIDEAMNEGHGDNDENGVDTMKELGKETLLAKGLAQENSDPNKTPSDPNKSSTEQEQIDPTQFLKVDRKNKLLSRKMPVALQEGALDDEGDGEEESEVEEEGENTQQMTIEEAFADDDVVQEFRQDKDAETNNSKAQQIDLSLPGWGSWGGVGIAKKTTKRKRRRFIIKGVKVPRKDDQRHIVIINEDTPQDLKKHLVDQVPHPFTSVEEYEASLRLPLGREWVPEIAHRKLTQPAVHTRMGSVIEPIDYESQTRSKLKEYR